jgi:hypothetical protein
MNGTVSVIEIPSEKELIKMTSRVISNNFLKQRAEDLLITRINNPVPLYGGQKESPIKHIVFISKENRTYDEIFGQIPRRGMATLRLHVMAIMFPFQTGHIKLKLKMPPSCLITINWQGQFAIGDNFYVDSDVSADGHRWLVNTYPNEWVETCTPASYGGNREYKPLQKLREVWA